MPRRTSFKSVLRGFLGTFTSRYLDYEGYWLFGFVVAEIELLQIDLLAPPVQGQGPLAELCSRARTTFARLAETEGVACWVESASLVIERREEPAFACYNNRLRIGYDLDVTVQVRSDLGRAYTETVSLFVAPHDPAAERRSSRPHA